MYTHKDLLWRKCKENVKCFNRLGEIHIHPRRPSLEEMMNLLCPATPKLPESTEVREMGDATLSEGTIDDITLFQVHH